jgi:hypothetical protein
MLNGIKTNNSGEADALYSVNPFTAILYLFAVAFVFSAILPGLR